MAISDFAPDFLTGRSEGQGGSLLDLAKGLPDIVGGAAGLAAQFTGIGDAVDLAAGATGRIGDYKLGPVERGLSLLAPGLGITAGIGMAGYAGYRRYRQVQGLQDMREVIRSLARDDRGVLDFTPVAGKPTVWQGTSVAEETLAHHPLGQVIKPPQIDPPEYRLVGASQLTNRALQAESYEELAGTFVVAPRDEVKARTHTLAFVETLGNRLVQEVPSHSGELVQKFGAQAPLMAAQWEFTKLFNAAEAGLFKKGSLQWVDSALDKLVKGTGTIGDRERLLDFTTQFARETQWINDPELAVSPLMRITSVDEGDGGLTWQLEAELFEDQGSWFELEKTERARRLAGLNHAAVVDQGVENLMSVLRQAQEMDDGTVFSEGLEWYERVNALLYGEISGDKLVVPVYRNAPQEPTGRIDVNSNDDMRSALQSDRPAEPVGRREYSIGDFTVPGTTDEQIAMVLDWKRANPDVSGEQLAAVVAAISAAMPWEQNIVQALRVIDSVRANEFPDAEAFRAVYGKGKPKELKTGLAVSWSDYSKAARIVRGEGFEDVWFGPDKKWHTSAKTASFRTNIIDPMAFWPVVMDRHAYSLFLGFESVADPPLDMKEFSHVNKSLRRSIYLPVADAYRGVTERWFRETGQRLLPQQVQAITWVAWRRMKDAHRAANNNQPFVMNRSILDMLEGRGPVNAELIETMGSQAPGLIEATAIRGRKSEIAGRKVTLEIGPTADVSVYARQPAGGQGFTNRDHLRHMHPTASLPGSGSEQRLWLPNFSIPVQSIDHLGAELLSTAVSRSGGGAASAGWREYSSALPPDQMASQLPGHHMVVNALADINGVQGEVAHERFIAMLKKAGVKAEAEVLPPHNGVSTAWETEDGLTWTPDEATRKNQPVRVDEARVGVRLTFTTPEDLRSAWALLNEPFVDADGKSYWRDPTMTDRRLSEKPSPDAKPWTWAEEIYGEQILDRYAVTSADGAAPSGTKRVWEHLFTDAQKRTLSSMSLKADPFRPNTSPVWVENEFLDFFKDSKVPRLEGGNVVNNLVTDEFSDGLLGGIVRLAKQDTKTKLKSNGLPKARTRAAMLVDPGVQPTMAFGEDAMDVLAHTYNADPSTAVTMRFGNDYVDVELPAFEMQVGTSAGRPVMREMVDMRLFDRAKAILAHLGERRTIRPKIREIDS